MRLTHLQRASRSQDWYVVAEGEGPDQDDNDRSRLASDQNRVKVDLSQLLVLSFGG
jgi:hypothetical protein